MIVIGGATGTIGSAVVRLLTGRAVPFRALSRTPTGAQVRADHTDPASLDLALADASALFLLGPGTAEMPAYDLALLDAARRAGVPHVVKLSAIPVGPVADFHRPGEEAVRAFPRWTLLRPGLFASNSPGWAPLIAAGQPVPTRWARWRSASSTRATWPRRRWWRCSTTTTGRRTRSPGRSC